MIILINGAFNPRADAETRRFRLGNVDRRVAARDELPADTLVLGGDQHTPAELAGQVLRALSLLTIRS